MKTFNIDEAANFLGAHKETIRRLAAKGQLPSVKIGRGWRFIEEDLVMYMRNKYSSSDASQGGLNRSKKEWRSTKKMVSGGSISPMVKDAYAEALGLK